MASEWLRVHGLTWGKGLWPPSFLDQNQLDEIGWPWPEWPSSQAEMKARKLGIRLPSPEPPKQLSFAEVIDDDAPPPMREA